MPVFATRDKRATGGRLTPRLNKILNAQHVEETLATTRKTKQWGAMPDKPSATTSDRCGFAMPRGRDFGGNNDRQQLIHDLVDRGLLVPGAGHDELVVGGNVAAQHGR